MKNVLLMVIDALTGPCMMEEVKNGRLPTFARIIEKSIYREQCTTIFPSITHAALSSLVTGVYPDQHGVLGSHWYVTDQQEVAYFSADLSYVFQKGLGNHLYDFIVKLNQQYLNAETPTLFEQADAHGIPSAAINYLLFRGPKTYDIRMPWMLQLLPELPAEVTLQGPAQFIMGSLQGDPESMKATVKKRDIFNWFGLHDSNTVDILKQLADNNDFPPLTVAYFPVNDEVCHRIGPNKAHHELGALDHQLHEFIEKFGGLEPFLEQFVFIITGDHSQSAVLADEQEAAIDLVDCLSGYSLAPVGQPWSDGDELMICTNMRAAQIYIHPEANGIEVADLADRLLQDKRIDQVFWPETAASPTRRTIGCSQNGRLIFWPHVNNRHSPMGVDRYGNGWSWEGELGVVNGRLQDGQLIFPDYPNAFERLNNVLYHPNAGNLWLTAKPGYEFIAESIDSHAGGGSHGSLHLVDSQAPLIVAGAPEGFTIPTHPRLIDIAPLCITLLQQEATTAAQPSAPPSSDSDPVMLQRRVQESEAIAAISHALATTLEPDMLLQLVVETVQRLLPKAEWTTIHLLDKEANQLNLAASAGLKINTSQYTILRGEGVAGQVLANGQSISVPDVQIDARRLPIDEEINSRALLVVPVESRHHILGVITVQSGTPNAFTHADERLLKILGVQSGMAIENARLFVGQQKARKRAERQREALRRLAKQILTAQESERERIARELHDESGQSLTAIKIGLELLEYDIPDGLATVKESLRELVEMVDQTMNNLRLLSHNLRPPGLEQYGLHVALEGMCHDIKQHTRVEVCYTGEADLALDSTVSLVLYRVAQEAVTNAIKYSKANCIKVRLWSSDDEVFLQIKDDGEGFTPPTPEEIVPVEGTGIAGMHERMQMINGRLEITAATGQGCQIMAVGPLGETA